MEQTCCWNSSLSSFKSVPPVLGDNPQDLASELSYIQVVFIFFYNP